MIRTPRDAFTRRLTTIAGRIAAQPERTLDVRSRYLPGIHRSSFRVTSLWVAGSWARGALECGDLDLFVTIEKASGIFPEIGPVRRLLIGGFPHVSLIIGHPHEWEGFGEALMVWSPEQPDYAAAIAKVFPDQSAGRFPRPLDALPVRFEQIRCDLEQQEELLRLKNEMIIDWEWISKDSLTLHPERWSPRARFWLEHGIFGKKTSEVVQYVFEIFAGPSEFEWERIDATVVILGTIMVHMGCRPFVPVHALLEGDISTLVIAPHISRRGPNGLWVIRPGKQLSLG